MRLQYVFRHLDQSEFIKNFAQDHIEKILTRYERDPGVNGTVKMEMENSPQQPGKDVYVCEIRLHTPHHGNLIIKKRTGNMYEAIAEACDKLSMAMSKMKGRFKARRRGTIRLNYLDKRNTEEVNEDLGLLAMTG